MTKKPPLLYNIKDKLIFTDGCYCRPKMSLEYNIEAGELARVKQIFREGDDRLYQLTIYGRPFSGCFKESDLSQCSVPLTDLAEELYGNDNTKLAKDWAERNHSKIRRRDGREDRKDNSKEQT